EAYGRHVRAHVKTHGPRRLHSPESSHVFCCETVPWSDMAVPPFVPLLRGMKPGPPRPPETVDPRGRLLRFWGPQVACPANPFIRRARLDGSGVSSYGGGGTHPCDGTGDYLCPRDPAGGGQGRSGVRAAPDFPPRTSVEQAQRSRVDRHHPNFRPARPDRPTHGC